MTETVWEKIKKRAEDLKSASRLKKVISGDEKERILKERAKKLSQNIFKEEAPDKKLSVVSVVSNDLTYGIPINLVEEVFEVNQISPIPCLPSYISGMVNYKGIPLTVLNLKELFYGSNYLHEKGAINQKSPAKKDEKGGTGKKSKEKLIIVKKLEILAGIQIDSIGGLIEISKSEIHPLFSTNKKESSNIFIKDARYQSKTILLIDIEALLKDERLVVNMAFNNSVN